MKKIVTTPGELAAAFTLWNQRFSEDPSAFDTPAAEILRGDSPAVLGERAAAFLISCLELTQAGLTYIEDQPAVLDVLDVPMPPIPAAGEQRPLSELRAFGLIWLINSIVFHPRGYALALATDDDGTVTGWGLQGDGVEPWVWGEPEEVLDELFARAQAILEPRPVDRSNHPSTIGQRLREAA